MKNINHNKEKQLGALQATQNTGSSSGCVTDTSVGPASVMVGNLVQGNRLAVAQGRDIGFSDDGERKVSAVNKFQLFNSLSLTHPHHDGTNLFFYFAQLASIDNGCSEMESKLIT